MRVSLGYRIRNRYGSKAPSATLRGTMPRIFTMADGGGSQDRNDLEGMGFTLKENNCQANVGQAGLMINFNPNVIGEVG